MVESTPPKSTGLLPMAHAANVRRSVDLQWVHLSCDQAGLMLARASDPVIAGQQAVLFYLYSPDLIALRVHLLAKGVKVSPITYSDYMPKGEIRAEDPNGSRSAEPLRFLAC